MREILFRGKDIKGNWYEGLLAHNISKDEWYISNKAGISTAYQVRPETIGQFTGLTDKNGVKIFEGDIVRYGDTIHKVVFEQRNGTAYFGLVYSPIETLPFGHYQDLQQLEVIGNIYDNPELIGGADDENT